MVSSHIIENLCNIITINEHSSIKIKDIYFDPYNIKNEVHDARVIFITHNHFDHFSITDILKVSNDSTIFVMAESMVNEALEKGLDKKRIVTVNPFDESKVDGISFIAYPAYNLDKKFHPKENNWVGYLVNIDEVLVYVAGDTDITEEIKNIVCDIALIPVGGTYTMDYTEAAELINYINPVYAIPTHYGTVAGSVTDGEKFKEALKDSFTEVVLKLSF